MANERVCGNCRAPLSVDAPQGLCPACLMKVAMAIGSTATSGERKRFVAPDAKDLGGTFPQLEILELIGCGGMGAVYKARQKQLDRIVALKILPPDVSHDPAFAERFAREAKALAKLHHPHIVTLYEFGESQGQFYFLMEYVDGLNLGQLLKARTVTPKEALGIVPQICDALQFAHEHGIVHRDIKPDNILLNKAGVVKIADFGVAKIVAGEGVDHAGSADALGGAPASETEDGKIVGTARYMAPEQFTDPREVDHRADIYALGVVLYELLTGELPGAKLQPPSRKVHIDVRLDEIVLRAMEPKPERRYQTAVEFRTHVESVTNGGTVESGMAREAWVTRIDSPPRFSRLAIIGASWAPFFLVFVILGLIPTNVESGHSTGPSSWQNAFGVPLAILGLTAPLGTTILGCIAVSQIRRSAGRIHGLKMAVFDALVFPLLALDLIIGIPVAVIGIPLAVLFDYVVRPPKSGDITALIIACYCFIVLTCMVIDFLIVRRVWRAVSVPVVNSNSTKLGRTAESVV